MRELQCVVPSSLRGAGQEGGHPGSDDGPVGEELSGSVSQPTVMPAARRAAMLALWNPPGYSRHPLIPSGLLGKSAMCRTVGLPIKGVPL